MRIQGLPRRSLLAFAICSFLLADVTIVIGDDPDASIAPSVLNNTSAFPSVTPSPSDAATDTNMSPSLSPSSFNSSMSPSTAPSSLSSSMSPSMEFTEPPTLFSSESPTTEGTSDRTKHKKRVSIGRIIAKTIAWLIVMTLCVLFFGAVMSNRYRIYYALRGFWYTILQMDCTRWLRQKMRLGDGAPQNGSLNEIIFEPAGDLSEGLMLNHQG